jgi:non-ribosomal peptide synthetase component F
VGTSNVEDIYELTPMQRGMLLHTAHDGATDMYLSQQNYIAEGELDPDTLVEAWKAVVQAHPALRTSFHWQGLDKPLQVVHRHVDLPVHRHDWSDVSHEEQQIRLVRLRTDDRAVGLDLTAAPPQRLNLIRLGDNRYGLTWTYHHLFMDGWSVRIFIGELLSHYLRLTVGGPPPPPAPPFRDYIAWLQRRGSDDAARSFWVNHLAGVTPSHLTPLLPADPQRSTGSGDRRTVVLPADVDQGLRDAAVRHRVTFGTIAQAAWAIVLRRYSGQAEVAFGLVTSGRPPELPSVDRMVGMFANTLPARVMVPDDGDLGAWLRDLQMTHAQMRRYDYIPLADIKRWAGAPGQQLFETLAGSDNYTSAVDALAMPDRLTFRHDNTFDKINYPVALSINPAPDGIEMLTHQERFKPGFIDEALEHLQATLTAITKADRLAAVISAAGPVAATPIHPAGPHATRPADGHGPILPATPLEEAVAAVYREILGLAEVDVTASFFELGGDSFDAVRAISRIDGASVGKLAAHPSVRELAQALVTTTEPRPSPPDTSLDNDNLDDEIAELEQQLATMRAAKAELADPRRIVPVPREGTLTCSYQQEAVWFMHQYDAALSVCHRQIALRLRGPLDVAALGRAAHALVVRHEALRTRFVDAEGGPRQVIEPAPVATPLPMTALSPDQVTQWAADERARPVGLGSGPVLRIAAARLGHDDHALVLVVHRVAADDWSATVLANDLAALYVAEVTGRPVELPVLDVQPADFAAWQRRWLDGPELDRQLGYWRDTLAGLSTVDLPTDRPRPVRPTGAGASMGRLLPTELGTAVHAYGLTERVPVMAVLHAALLTVLHRYTDQVDLPIGSMCSGRTRPDIEPLVGYFASTVVLRTDLSGDPSFTELVHRCDNTFVSATAHQDVPFSLVVDALRPARIAGRHPLFQVGLTVVLPGNGSALPMDMGNTTAEFVDVPEHRSRYDIGVDITDSPDGQLRLRLMYSTELFDADRMHRFLDHYVTALANGLAAPDTAVGAIALTTTRPGVVSSARS